MLNQKQPFNKAWKGSATKEMETLQEQEENRYNNEQPYQDENWKVVTAHKKRKIILDTSAMKLPDAEK